MWIYQAGVTEDSTEKKCGAEADLQICNLPVTEQSDKRMIPHSVLQLFLQHVSKHRVIVQPFIMFPSNSTLGQSCLSLSCIQLLDSAEFPERTEQKGETSAVLLRILLLSLCRLVSSFTSTSPVRPSLPSRLRPPATVSMSAMSNCVSDT